MLARLGISVRQNSITCFCKRDLNVNLLPCLWPLGSLNFEIKMHLGAMFWSEVVEICYRFLSLSFGNAFIECRLTSLSDIVLARGTCFEHWTLISTLPYIVLAGGPHPLMPVVMEVNGLYLLFQAPSLPGAVLMSMNFTTVLAYPKRGKVMCT